MAELTPNTAKALRLMDEKGFLSREGLAQLAEADSSLYARLAESLGISPSEMVDLVERREVEPAQVRMVF